MPAHSLLSRVLQAHGEKKLLDSSRKNLEAWLQEEFLPGWALKALQELVDRQEWTELNDRFFETIAFGTGGMRSRTIGRVSAEAELGQTSPRGTPEHPAVGSAYLNDFNIIRATIGLYRYAERYLRENRGWADVPRLVIARDVRHFSAPFANLAASTWKQLGGVAMVFDGPRSTPQLSFTVRRVGATCGIVITASHNPPHDNGYKVYFEDGGQVVSPHAEGIIHEVYRVRMREVVPFLKGESTGVIVLPSALDEAYHAVVREVVLDPENLQHLPRVVFSPIHGTGGVSVPPVLQSLGAKVDVVGEQMLQDPRFPTVKSPNPENAEALSRAIAQAKESGAELVVATDPDADRMGAAVSDGSGEMVLLTGNIIGSLLAEFRIRSLKAAKLLPDNGSPRAALIKTFVTTPLQDAIAARHGLKCINTLTGFKWIGEKLHQYEQELLANLREADGLALDYDATTTSRRRELLLKHSTYYVFGGEESYGYLASDLVRDKDANAAVVMLVELMGWLKRRGTTVLEFLDELYLRYGFFQEDLINIYYEGASGSQRIRSILDSYRAQAPRRLGSFEIAEFQDFGTQELRDTDGRPIPKQDFFFVTLDNGYRYAVRGSGTEPKLKIYLFAREDVPHPAALATAREKARTTLKDLKQVLEADTRKRAGE